MPVSRVHSLSTFAGDSKESSGAPRFKPHTKRRCNPSKQTSRTDSGVRTLRPAITAVSVVAPESVSNGFSDAARSADRPAPANPNLRSMPGWCCNRAVMPISRGTMKTAFLRGRACLLFFPAAMFALWAQPPAGPAPEAAGPAGRPVVFLWPGVAPGSEGKSGEEKVRVQESDRIVSGVHRPSIAVYLPAKETASGAAVIVAPGGSYRELWITHEGYRVAEWLSQHGIAGFVLKYRLPREAGSTYTVEGTALSDMQRAIRTVRAHAAEWGIDPRRIGVMGFSAGAHLAGLAAAHYDDAPKPAGDDIDRQSARPAFQALIYPPKLEVTYSADTPQAFLACGGADQVAADMPNLYQALKKAGVATELHIYAGVGHGFGIRAGNPPSVAGWIERFRDWMSDRGLLTRQ